MIHLWQILFILPFLSGREASEPHLVKCKVDAKVLDYTALDGCRFILELKDGTRLMPVELSDKEFLFSEGQQVKITYTEAKGVVSTCMTSAVPVKIECIQQVKEGTKPGQVFIKKECYDTEAPLNVAWLNRVILRNKVIDVKKGYENQLPYYVLYGNVNVMLFNCAGGIECEYALTSLGSCSERIESLSNLKSVWSQK